MKAVLLFRKAVLAAAGSRIVKKWAARYGMKLGVGRFIAAESLAETVVKVRTLNERGFAVTLDYLGESVMDRFQAYESAEVVIQTLNEIERAGLDSNVSLKLTQLGLLIDEDFCFKLTDRIVERAKRLGNFVRIDMEDSSVTERTLRLYHKLLQRHGKEHVGIVIQAYLYRSRRDLYTLADTGSSVRIVKGAYSEPSDIAFPLKKAVDREFTILAETHLLAGCPTAIATHDERIIETLKQFAERRGIPREQFEFQMLYGISEHLQLQLVEEGYRVRIYTPFGKHWFPYFTRRIAERPANLLFVAKAIIGRKKRSTSTPTSGDA